MRTLVLGTAGHIDHGKSALVEALTGTHPDRLKEEQARGITIELGFAHAQVGDVSVALVDVPGHERFVRTMLAGAGGLDAVLLVIAANESVMPQTREHLDICRLLGVDRGLIVLTKSDLVDDDTLALATLDARELVAGTPLAASPVLAVSARTGAGLPALRDAIVALAAGAGGRRATGAARVPIDRAFSVKGFGTVVTGTLVSGQLALEDEVQVLPGDGRARVRGLQVHGATVATVHAPRRVAVNLGGVDLRHVHRGMTLAAPGALPVTRRIDVRLDLLPGSPALRQGARVRVHQGTAEVGARVSVSATRATAADPWVVVPLGRADVSVPSGGQAYARLRLAGPMVVTRGDRFVVRAPSPARTIGGGVVLDPEPPRSGVRRSGIVTRFLESDGGGGGVGGVGGAALEVVVLRWLDEAGLAGLTLTEVARRAGVGLTMTEMTLRKLTGDARVVSAGASVVSADSVAAAVTAVKAHLTTHHKAHPDEVGPPREEVRMRVAKTSTPATFDVVLAAAGVVDADRVSLSTHRPVVTDDDARVRDGVLQVLRAAGLQPPDVAGIATGAGADVARVQRVLIALGKDRRVVKLADLWFHGDVLAELRSQVRALGAGVVFDVAAAKARFGVSRKFAIPLLEHLDRERITRRTGDKRVVL